MAGAKRTISLTLRAEVGQFNQAMGSAAKATSQVADAAEKTSKQVDSAAKSTAKVGDGAAGAAKKSQSALSQMATSASKNEQAWRTVGTTLTVAGGAVTAFGAAALKTGIEYNTLQQTSRAALTSLLGSAQAANEQMDKLDEFAKSSPFSKSTFITAQQQMLAFGIEAKKVVPYLDAIQNAVAAAGGSNDDIAGISETFSKIQSSAKITAEDLNELGSRGVNAAELIGSQMGMTGAQVRDAITNGTIGAEDALDALAAGMSSKFDGAADNVKNTFAGAMDRVKAAWRDFSAELAAPLVNPEGGGALVSMLNGIADAMRGFSNLPDPLKELITGLGAIGGLAATATGGLILLVPKAVELWKSFRKLADDMPKVASGLKGVGRAAGAAAAIFAALEVADTVAHSMQKATESTEETTQALLDMGEGTKSLDKLFAGSSQGLVGAGKGIDTLQDAIDRIVRPDFMDRLNDVWGEIRSFGKDEGGTDRDRVVKQFNAIGDSLGQLVTDGNVDLAKEKYKQLAAAWTAQGGDIKDLNDMLPGYTAALADLSNKQKIAAQSGQDLASWQDQLAAALESTNPSIAAQAEAYQGLIDGSAKAGQSFLDLSDDLGDAKFSLDGWLDKLEKQAKAQKEWADNLGKLAAKGASTELLQGLIDQGPDAAQAVAGLADGTVADMKRAEDAIGGVSDETAGLQNQLGQKFVMEVKTDAVKREGKSTKEYIDGLTAAIEITGNEVPAKEDGEDAEHYISRLRAVMGIDANGNPARKEGESASNYIKRLKTFMKINGNSVPARKEGESAEHYISRLRAKMGIDANGNPARKEGESTSSFIKRLKQTMKIQGDAAPARKEGESAEHYISRLQGYIKTGAKTGDAISQAESARSTIDNMSATINVTTINKTRNIVENVAKNHGVNLDLGRVKKATGGRISGPGSGTSDDVPIMASNGEHMWTAAEVQAAGGHDAMYRMRAAAMSGDLPQYASGGAVSAAERSVAAARRQREAARTKAHKANAAVKAAEKAERRAEKTKSKSDDKAAKQRLARAQKTQSAAQKALDKRDNTLQKQRDRLAALRETQRDTRIGIRRGDQRESATSGLSGAYSLVDEMFSVARSGNMNGSYGTRLAKRAYATEKSMRRLYKDSDGIAKKLEKATSKMEELQQISDSVADTLTGGFNLGDTKSAWTGKAATSGKEYLASAQAYASKTKAFASKLLKLRKAGYSGVILQEVAGMGVEEGTVAADALLQLNPKDTKAMNTAYKDIETYAGKAGQYVSAGFYEGGLAAAEGLVSGLKKDQKKINKQINNMATSMIKALRKALGIHSPSTVFRDLGLQTGDGMALGLNQSVGKVAAASEQLVSVPAAVSPSVYTTGIPTSSGAVTVTLPDGEMQRALDGTTLTLQVDGKPVAAVVHAEVTAYAAGATATMRGGRR